MDPFKTFHFLVILLEEVNIVRRGGLLLEIPTHSWDLVAALIFSRAALGVWQSQIQAIRPSGVRFRARVRSVTRTPSFVLVSRKLAIQHL